MAATLARRAPLLQSEIWTALPCLPRIAAADWWRAAGIRTVLPGGAGFRSAGRALDLSRDPRAARGRTALQRDSPRRAAPVGDAAQAAAPDPRSGRHRRARFPGRA